MLQNTALLSCIRFILLLLELELEVEHKLRHLKKTGSETGMENKLP